MADDTPFQDFPAYADRPSKKPKIFFVFVVLFLLVVALFVGLYLFGINANKEKGAVASVPTPMVTPTIVVEPTITDASESATPSPKDKETKEKEKTSLDRSGLTLVVLNGSGVAGAAGDLSTELKNLGYTIPRVGNASQFDYEGITIYITEEASGYLPQLEKDITAYDDSVIIETIVDDTISTDAEVVVGK